MNDNDKVALYGWTIIGLVVALVVVVALWFNSNDPEVITNNFREDVRDYREEIRSKCTFTATTTGAERRVCEETLEEFSDILREYRNDMEDATGTTTLPLGTTTSSGTSTQKSGTILE